MITRSGVRGLVAAGALALATTMVAGCVNAEAPESLPPSASAAWPQPAGVSLDVPIEPPPATESCDATASLTPGPLPEPGKMPPGTTTETIYKRGWLKVGLDIGSNLLSFRDPISGTIEGFDVDVAKELARAIFGDPERIEFRILNSDDRMNALKDSTVDVVVKTMSITCQRLRDIAFSTVYYEASQRILTMRSSDINGVADLAGKRVCAARGTTSIARIQQRVPDAIVDTVSTWADCLVMVQQGQVDAVSTDDAILAGMAAQDPYVHVVGQSLGEEPYGIGLNKNDEDLVRFTNGVLQKMREDGTWFDIYDRWLSILGPKYYPPQPSYRD
ncbi:amino acid ABC transporter substrate-binding protein (PAAT family) [Williamsia muralis]|uniref:Amino acid ABC transporter substrate-binding protein (PAAT family) n=1 Tax=Williamsia marianensis TaxID=85044 RepID=A0A495K753_WILMA|nr:glutamate ABC transporter substrate-binding protein [Williamsia muralis]RKR97143.1 amino acid ABC transporter substrate-binding protein (PAAT family) [Williamsia muralis]